jgi:hypothetical protein
VKREVSWMPHAPVGAKKGVKKQINVRGITYGELTLVKDQNRDLLADSHNIVNRWKNFVYVGT